MLFLFDDLLTILKGVAENSVQLSEDMIYDFFKGNYEFIKAGDTLAVFCDSFTQNLFAVVFVKVDNSDKYRVDIISTPKPSKYIYVRR